MICSHCGNKEAYWIAGGEKWSCCNQCKMEIYFEHMEAPPASDLHIKADWAGDTKGTWAKGRVFENSFYDKESNQVLDKRTGRPAEY